MFRYLRQRVGFKRIFHWTSWPHLIVAVLCLVVVIGKDSFALAGSMSLVDPRWNPYTRASGISGNLNSIGSDTLNNLMTLWAEGFRKQYPNVKIQIEGKGSSTAPPALIEGTAQLGPMSRKMKGSEIDKFEAKFGYKPTAFPVAIDALAVYVNKDNPIAGMTLAQVDAVFSKTRRRNYPEDITVWGQLGLTGPWKTRRISLYGRNSASGTYGYFKKVVLKNGDYKDSVKEQPGSASVVQGVTKDLGGIGYSGIGYRTSGVRTVPLAVKEGGPFYEPSFENAMKGTYPISRFLYVYVNKTPGKPLPPLVREFLRFVYSKEGQTVVIKDGYFPLPQRVIDRYRQHIDHD
ncbi:MAG: phosphate ABC transporter substrate-binding protein PstS family protein [Nitrospirae bacterium]|nr:MAG: phosphate ABC transporter substrate-binding protein PstS family protein [Nitrospirota bacterium]